MWYHSADLVCRNMVYIAYIQYEMDQRYHRRGIGSVFRRALEMTK